MALCIFVDSPEDLNLLSPPSETHAELLHKLISVVLGLQDEATLDILQERLCEEAATRGSDEVDLDISELEGVVEKQDMDELEQESAKRKLEKAFCVSFFSYMSFTFLSN